MSELNMFDWNEFKILAEKLKNEKDEASQRTATSRLYYAIYWKARLQIISKGYRYVRNQSSHKQIWDEYLRKSGLDNQDIGNKGKELHKNRIKADYFDEIKKLNDLVEDSFLVADEILVILKRV